jgi:hypothetical protein
MYVQRICRAMNVYDNVVTFVSGVEDWNPIREIEHHPRGYQYVDWSWGYCPEQFEHDPTELAWYFDNPTYYYLHHEGNWIPPELRNPADWEDHEIFLGGGARDECLQDMKFILQRQKIPYKTIEGLVF